MIQAEDRAHRIGQEHECVNIHYLYGHDTIDEVLFKMLNQKQNIFSNTLDNMEKNMEVKNTYKKVGDFQKGRDDLDVNINNILDYRRINKYKNYNKLKKAILTFIASRLSCEESSKLREIFLNMDEDKNGYISFEDFRKYVINEYDIDDLIENEEELKKGFEGVDIDHNNRIDFLWSCTLLNFIV